MTESELRNRIKGDPRGRYLFWGDEDYLKRYYLAQLREAALRECPPGLEALNRITLTLEDGDWGAIEAAAAAPPMMAPLKIVEITPPSLDAIREKDRKALLAALESAARAEDTVLVLVAPAGTLDAGTPKRPTAYFKNLSAVMEPVEFPLQTGVRLRRWVERHFADAGVSIPESASAALLARCPADMTGLSGEIEKLVAYALAHGKAEITSEDVLHVTSPGIREDAFGLANAVLAGDRAAALSCLDGYRKRREEPIAVLASLCRVVSDLYAVAVMSESGMDKSDIARATKMHEYKAALYLRSATALGSPRLAAALDRCREADRQLKSTNLGYIAIERVVCTMPRIRG